MPITAARANKILLATIVLRRQQRCLSAEIAEIE